MSQTYLAFARLNLRRNPFGEMNPEARASLAVVDLGDIAERIQRPGNAVQFLAPHGRGKTTHLLALRRQVPSLEFQRIVADGVPEFEGERTRLIDSFDKLGRRQRKLAYRSSTSLAVTTHIDLAEEFHRAGYQVTTRVVRTVDAGTLAEIFRQRIEWVRRDSGPVPTVSPCQIAHLMRAFGTDVRAMEAELYTWFESWRKQ